MKLTAKFAGALLGAMTFSGAALASSTTPPGERAGLDLASPLPEGVYFLNIGSVGSWRGSKGDNAFDYDVPILAWSTPWTILDGRIQFLGAIPTISASAHNGIYERGLYNPFVAGQIAWNLGNGFSVSYLAGAYIGIGGTNAYYNNGAVLATDPLNQTTFHQQLALAWHGGGWNATANLMYGIVGNNDTSHVANPDYFNYDLGLTKTIGKWEVGIVGYGSTDVGRPYASYAMQSQFALGGLVGYNFGPVITQLTVSTDLVETNYVQKETRGVLRTVIPLWNPEAPKAVVAKY
ncbi:hypothetical protein CCR94_03605 [Rhodoblastus sphagnicola]|uniref:CoxB-like protein n=1 Tax=Rhodoblastus sphagnicola TaxID=333368 RepID=A0A2S6NDR9_9HYPH|nr:transporter [Rhodoblastus sphagnicola]MBB4198545.1 hypothetical protein [Rhodoblastus sphagnicola]PPQ32743.1 hypothetical protein CCR94_03605 [Rhodoblastus sphagnicola]